MLIALDLQPLQTTTTLGRRYGTFIPFLDIKPCCGESFKMLFQ
jgi:hypothetical protein